MLVFSKAKLVFLSVPKTGTTAYTAALAPLASMVVNDPPELKHSPVFRYNRFFRPMLEKFVGDGFDVMAVMREPIDWLGSWYRYRRREANTGAQNSTHHVNFDEFVQAYLLGQRPAFAQVGSQAKFLEPQRNGTAITHLFRYEDPENLNSFLDTRLSTQIVTKKMNVSLPMRLELTEKTETRLRRKMLVDFDLYESIGKNGQHTPLRPAPAPNKKIK